jgi:hypothetical protein
VSTNKETLERLLECAANGKFWQPQQLYRGRPKTDAEINDPDPWNDDLVVAHAADWHPDRTIDARIIRVLLIGAPLPGEKEPRPVHAKGLCIMGSRISGLLDLEGVALRYRSYFSDCAFDQPIILARARALTISFEGSSVPAGSVPGLLGNSAIYANGLRVKESVFLGRGFVARGLVDLASAQIKGSLLCNGGSFLNKGGIALDVSGAVVRHNVDLGTVPSERGAAIEKRFRRTSRFTAVGGVNLVASRMETLTCNGGRFFNRGGMALDVSGSTIKNIFFGRNFFAYGAVNLVATTIKGQLSCGKGNIRNKLGVALNAASARIEGGAYMRDGFVAHGEVILIGAHIKPQMEWDNATIRNPGAMAFTAGQMEVSGDLFMRDGFKVDGELYLARAKIHGHLRLHDATISNKNKNAVNLAFAEIDNGLFFSGAKPGEVTKHCSITGNLNLTQASCRTYSDHRESWPKNGHIKLDGFTYERFHDCETGWKHRLEWLLRQPPEDTGHARLNIPPDRDPSISGWRQLLRVLASIRLLPSMILRGCAAVGGALLAIAMWFIRGSTPRMPESFRPQPWTQAVKVLRDMGHDDDARELAMQREIVRARSTGTRWHLRLWLNLLRVTIGNGYRPQLALYWSLGFFLFSWAIFAAAANMGFMAPREGSVQVYLAQNHGAKLPEHFTRFNAIIFALDNYLPIIELGQDQAWEPTDIQTGHRRDAYLKSCWYVEAGRLAFGHDWSITGSVTANSDKKKVDAKSSKTKNAPQPKPNATCVSAPRPKPNDGIIDSIAAVFYSAFSLGFHRFVYWTMELLGWLFVSLYIAGMSGIMKRE